MKKALFAVYGASGFGREVMPVIREQLRNLGVGMEHLVFVDDNPAASEMNGHRILTYTEFLAEEAIEHYVTIAIADGEIRERIAARCSVDGVLPISVTSTTTVAMDDVSVGEGVVLCPFVTLTSNVRIGKFFHANIYSYVAHDCVIGDYVTFAPGVKCNGNIVVEDFAYIGTGAVIKQGAPGSPLVIGRGAVVGMGAVVTKNVPPGAVVVGNPARMIQR